MKRRSGDDYRVEGLMAECADMRFSQNQIRERLDYDPSTGIFIWRERAITCWRHKVWNKRFAGKIAGRTNDQGYVSIGIDGFRPSAHRLAWLHYYGSHAEMEIDHINRNPSDNRIANLRAASQSQNRANSKIRKNNKLGAKGVSRNGKKYSASIKVDGVRIYLGTYDTVDDASRAYAEASRSMHGEFGRVA